MTVPFWCIAIVWFMAYPPSWAAVLWILKHDKYDNHLPRQQAARLTGFAMRAKSAHFNSLEAVPGFAAGVFVAHLGGGDPTLMTQLCLAFIAVRLVYVALYLADFASARSLAWSLGLGLNGALFLLPVLK